MPDSTNIKINKLIMIFCLCSSALFLSLLLFRPFVIEERIETLTLDYRFHLRNLISGPAPSGEIVIVAVDEKSLKEFGRWPWSRTLVGELVQRIKAFEPRVLAVDIFFSEPETKEADKAFGDILTSFNNKAVLALPFDVWVDRKNPDVREIPEEITNSAFLKMQGIQSIHPVTADDMLHTVPEILRNNLSGHVYSHPDHDGKLRWELMYLKYGDEFYPSLAVQTARLYLGIMQEDMSIRGEKGVSLGPDIFIPSDSRGRMLINYMGKEGAFSYISASDILHDKIRKEALNDRAVVLGTTAIATYDLKNSPFSANMPGVEINATVISSILKKAFLTKSRGYIEIAVILLSGLITGLMLPRLSSLKGALLSFMIFFLYLLAALLLFTYNGLWINVIYPSLNIMNIAVFVTVSKYFFEEKKTRAIKAMFSSYVSPKIVEELINNPEKAKLGGERRVVTILFADIIGFTSFSERNQPEDVVKMLNEYFREMTDIIFRWDGTLDKIVGDQIMAFWGAPADQPNHAELAIRCALNMTDILHKLHIKWRDEDKDVLDIGIGINTGEVIVGNIGSAGKKMDYTVIGDPVNLASRAEKITRDFQARVLITENTTDILSGLIASGKFGHIELTERDTVKVKGKEKRVKVFELKSISQ